jgi:hypothetical protein
VGHVRASTPAHLSAVVDLLDLVMSPAGLGGYHLAPRTGRIDDEDAWEWGALHMAARAYHAALSGK